MADYPLRVAAWNVGQQAGYNGGWRRPAELLAQAVAGVHADVAVITEYVPKVCPTLPRALRDVGLTFTIDPRDEGMSNHVLIASRHPVQAGAVEAPDFDTSARTNARHAWLPTLQLHVFGVRVPAYEHSAEVDAFWAWLNRVREQYRTETAILLGDMNIEEAGTGGTKAARAGLAAMKSEWTLATAPADQASYFARQKGKVWPRRIDLAFVSSALRPRGAQYFCQSGGHQILNTGAALSRSGFLSDHALLAVDVEPTVA